MTEAVPVFAEPSPRIRKVPVDRPWAWLAAGWRDLANALPVSLAYGVVIAGVSLALVGALVLADYLWLLLPMTAGFFLVAPLLAVGIYETSRRLDAGEHVGLAEAVGAYRRNATQIANLGVVLLLIHLAWIRIATLLYALFFENAHPNWENFVDTVLFSPISLPFLAVGGAIGFVLAAVVFALSAVSIPMLLDRDVNVFTAIATSVAAVRLNWKPMALWAALIVVFTAIGLAAFFVGIAVVLPLVGHATWHAYRDVVQPA